MGASGSRRETLTVAALCVAWYALSSASNVVGKVALTEFPYPLTVAAVQLAAVVACSAPALAACGVRAARFPPGYYWRVLLPLAVAKVLTTLCSQISIWKVPVSYAHTGQTASLLVLIF
ncbi:hypothetical protein O3G_MSEX009174 [Manduca sexta]|uniref:Sugar phosphate transporter domain-containing protein n=1 Tax=Manduca sexta TaxID=7130 RepID=A0A921ZE92_MANSE|nr:hypothetical protein O3G_MSEX009174 [Manduca sexta]